MIFLITCAEWNKLGRVGYLIYLSNKLNYKNIYNAHSCCDHHPYFYTFSHEQIVFILVPIPTYLCGETSNSKTPTACPTIQLSADTIWIQHHVPQVKGLVLQDYCPPSVPNSDAKLKGRLSPVLLTDWLYIGYRTSLSLINLPVQLTELREILYLLDFRLNIQMEEMHKSRYIEKYLELPCPL